MLTIEPVERTSYGTTSVGKFQGTFSYGMTRQKVSKPWGFRNDMLAIFECSKVKWLFSQLLIVKTKFSPECSGGFSLG